MANETGSLTGLPAESDGGVREMADLARLYEAHAPFVRDLAARLVGPAGDPEDLVQEAFVIAWRRQDALARGVPARAWLTGILLKLVQASRRARRVRRFLGLDAAAGVADAASPSGAFERREASRLVYEALDGLSDKKRTVFVLFELQELTGPEIAEALGCPVQTVKTRLFYARQEFEKRLRALTAGKEQGR